ncbi:hypothetical protein SGFS_061510 [Streptomyces graminofaciens]|uniref:Uncharacterized protein n=1 Tax=Streptomyces graminofaciens TaxID=68212 RepID=A0ABM7FF58_9ACTN|nr:hypothetical protein [Streptomyces graminofaciens]BBC34857.1 hypothetical protein SGFS_061510 [Streptomyces graminofaciens]
MHSRLTTRRLATVAVAGAATLAVLAPVASAADAHQDARPVAAQAAAKLPAKLTVNGYLAYLKSQKTPEARTALKGFAALPAAKKAKFVSYLQDAKVYGALHKELGGPFNVLGRNVQSYNADVKFVHTVTSKKNVKEQKGSASVAYTVTETIYGIPVTSEKLSLSYSFKGTQAVPRTGRAAAKVTNVNAAVAIKGGPVKIGIKGIARADVTWKAVPKVAAFGKAVNKDQAVKGQPKTWGASILNG